MLGVSLIVLTKNSERTIVRCLNSIRKQQLKNIETLIIDCNSSDKTLALTRQFISEKIKLIEVKSNVSDAALANIAYKYASKKLIFIIKGNQYLSKNCVKNSISFFRKYPEIGLMQVRNFSRNIKKNKRKREDIITAISNVGLPVKVKMGPYIDKKFLYEIFSPSNFGIVINSKAVTNGKIFDPFIESDLIFVELAWRVWAAGYKVVYNPTTHVTTIKTKKFLHSNLYKKFRDLLRINFVLPSNLEIFKSTINFAYVTIFVSLGKLKVIKMMIVIVALIWNFFALPSNLIRRYKIQKEVRRRGDEDFLKSLMVKRKVFEVYDEFFLT